MLKYLTKKELYVLGEASQMDKKSVYIKPTYANTAEQVLLEKTSAVHMCEKKRRALQKNEKRVQVGFYAFPRFYKLSAGAKKEKTYEEFCNSPYYTSCQVWFQCDRPMCALYILSVILIMS